MMNHHEELGLCHLLLHPVELEGGELEVLGPDGAQLGGHGEQVVRRPEVRDAGVHLHQTKVIRHVYLTT